MKKTLGLIAVSLLMASPVLADETTYNCDAHPSCEVAPGIYGKMSNPVTSKFKLSLGGYVKLDYAYNSVNLGPAGMITPGTGAFPSRNLQTNAFFNSNVQAQSIFSVDQTRLWFKVDGPTFLGAKTAALVEGDFYGSVNNYAIQESPGFRIRLAYGTLDWPNTQILFGQYWDMFAPMVSSTQDFRSGATTGAPNTPRTPQIRLTQKINFNQDNQLKLVVAAVDPQQNGDNVTGAGTPIPTGAYTSMPNFAGQAFFISKALGTAPGYFGMPMNPFTIGFFGQYGTMKDEFNNGKTIPTWGAGVYTFVPILKSKDGKSRAMTMSLEGQAYEAANMTYNSATAAAVTGNGIQFDVNSAKMLLGSQAPAKGIGYTGQLIFYPIQDLGITAGYGIRKVLNNSDYTSNFDAIATASPIASLTNYQVSTSQIYANVAYDLNAAVRLAVEYQNLKTVYGNAAIYGITNTLTHPLGAFQTTGVDNTVRLCAYYFF